MSATANGAGLAQRVAALEQQVALLAAASQGEALQPNYLTVNPDGSTGALFAGGLQLKEQTSFNYGAVTALGWVNALQAITEWITGVRSGNTHTLAAYGQADASDYASVQLQSIQAGVAGSASVHAQAFDSQLQFVQDRTLIQSDGKSDFLQLPSTKQLALQGGVTTVAHAGGGSVALPVNLPTAWSTSHFAFVATAAPFSSYTGVYMQGSQVNTLAQGSAQVNSTPAQNFSVTWISLGY